MMPSEKKITFPEIVAALYYNDFESPSTVILEVQENKIFVVVNGHYIPLDTWNLILARISNLWRDLGPNRPTITTADAF